MKKKICILSMFIVAMIAVIFSIDKKEVKAETNSCTTYTNYYLMLDAVTAKWYSEEYCDTNTVGCDNNNGYINGEYVTLNSKNYSLGIPENAINIKEGKVTVDTNANGIDEMTFSKFYEVYEKGGDNISYPSEDAEVKYIRAVTYIDGEEQTGSISVENESTFTSQIPGIQYRASHDIDFDYDEDGASVTIKRTWSDEKASWIFNNEDYYDYGEQFIDGKRGKSIFDPIAWYVQYDVCNSVTIKYLDVDTDEEVMDPYVLDLDGETEYSYTCPNNVPEYTLDETEDTEFSGEVNGDIVLPCYYKKNNGYKVNVHFVDKDTKEKIKSSIVTASELTDGASYEYTCKNDISNYDLDTKTKIVGTIDGEDADLYCNYTKKKMTLTVDYGTDFNCTDAGAIRKSESKDYVWGTKVEYTIPKIDGYEFSELGTSSKKIESGVKLNSKETAFSLTMPAKNASICLVYIKNSQTGAGWIYFAWIIGIGALVYSIYYFRKYYRNNEV